MSNFYTEKLKPIIIEFIEEGLTCREISKLCNVSENFVKSMKHKYDQFYAQQKA